MIFFFKEGYKPGEVFSEDPHHFYPEFEFNFPSEQNQEEIKNVLNEERRKRKKEKKRKVKVCFFFILILIYGQLFFKRLS